MNVAPARAADVRKWQEMGEALFAQLRSRAFDGVGVTRECYAPSEQDALDLCRNVAENHGLRCTLDAAGNLWITRPDDDPGIPGLVLGSHIDSVPQGGNYDGAAGVVAALLCLIHLQEGKVLTKSPVRALALRGEESPYYGRSSIGSRALLGVLSAGDLCAAHRDSGRTLRDALRGVDADIARIERGEGLIDPATVTGYLELHIEQGPVMLARGTPTAVVTGIRGNIRHQKIICRGKAGHSGAVPREYREDALFAVSELVMRLDECWAERLARGHDLVLTISKAATDQGRGSVTRIPSEMEFGFEVRSQSEQTLRDVHALLRSECDAVGHRRRVTFEFDDAVYTAPAIMHERMVKQLLLASERLNLPVETIASGAGHDAAVFATAGIPTGMIFVRNANGSHNPEESLEMDDFMLGVELMTAFVTGDGAQPAS